MPQGNTHTPRTADDYSATGDQMRAFVLMLILQILLIIFQRQPNKTWKIVNTFLEVIQILLLSTFSEWVETSFFLSQDYSSFLLSPSIIGCTTFIARLIGIANPIPKLPPVRE